MNYENWLLNLKLNGPQGMEEYYKLFAKQAKAVEKAHKELPKSSNFNNQNYVSEYLIKSANDFEPL